MDSNSDLFKIKFWGVRGSRPVPGKDTLIFGGNTSCVSVEIDGTLLILDAGTGICNLATELEKSKNKIQTHMFITHTHWDHIQGFPFFTPAFTKGNEITLYGQNKLNNTFFNLMKGQMAYEHFPVQLEEMAAQIDFKEVKKRDKLRINENIVVRTETNHHPGGSISYRIEYKGKRSCCYITDNEHGSCVDNDLKAFVKGADVVIYDANFTDSEYYGEDGQFPRIGWGHSTWQEGIKLMEASDAKDLILFHHAIYRTDKELYRIEQEAKKRYGRCAAAAEGMAIELK
jgi:phosphoribosyl 1,2-cyclic phosphodiesterase